MLRKYIFLYVCTHTHTQARTRARTHYITFEYKSYTIIYKNIYICIIIFLTN